jgi:double-stranded uracil-DNA glycosylase
MIVNNPRAPPPGAARATMPGVADGVSGVTTLPDLLAPGLRLVVVGINPSRYSAAAGHYYARPGNDFWRLLATSGLTERVLDPAEDHDLPRLGIGLTDLVKTPTGRAEELPAAAFAGALEDLRARLARVDPAVVLFNGADGLRRALGRRPGFGRLDPGVPVGRAAVLCAPSTSGAARGRRALTLEVFREAARLSGLRTPCSRGCAGALPAPAPA